MPALQLLDMANRRGVPTAIFGHGLGPLTDPEIFARAREILPRVGLVALREGRTGPSLARALGVAPERVVVTGDDAIELAFESRPDGLGAGIGVNVRVSRSAGVGPETLERLRPLLQAFARSRGVALLPVPISFNERASARAADPKENGRSVPDLTDSGSIRELLSGWDETSDGGESLRTVRAVIEQVGRCRIVVTGAYHAAVFALSQGISTVCLARSDYFAEKLLGLADQFGRGCEVITLDGSDLEARLSDAMSRAWDDADDVRPRLLDAARRQIDCGQEAYRRLAEDVLGVRSTSSRAGVVGS
jgi:colanic acid/amylovoran biosynthesis protein